MGLWVNDLLQEKNKPIPRDRFRYWLNGDSIHVDRATILSHRVFAAHIWTILNIFELPKFVNNT